MLCSLCSWIMATWANPTVARLATGDRFDGENVCGLVLVCAWPMPPDVQEQAAALCEELRAELPSAVYVYPPSTLHITIATLRAFANGPMDPPEVEACVALWIPILDAARASPAWPTRWPFRVRMDSPTLEGAAGIWRYADLDGSVSAMRSALRGAIADVGGLAVEGGGDRSLGRPPAGAAAAAGGGAPHIPDIVHSTVVRWAAEPGDRSAAAGAFDRAARRELSVERAAAVFERVPYMHMLTVPPGGEGDAGADEFGGWSA